MVKFHRGLILSTLLFAAANLSGTTPAKRLSPSLSRFQFKQDIMQSIFESGTNSAVRTIQPGEQKNKARAFFQSLILPGWGQHYAESKSMMKVFIASEVALLGSFAWFRARHNWLKDDYRTFAVTHAGVATGGKNDRYFVDIGNFDDIFAFNQEQLRNRDVSRLYPEADEFFWQWDSEENRREFEDMRVRSDRAKNRSEMTLAFIFVNHLVSAIHSTLAVFKHNRRLGQPGLGFRMKSDYDLVTGYQVTFGLVKHF